MATAKDTNTQRDVQAKLVHSEVAERLSLTDAQRARFQTLLLDRSQSLLTAESDEVRSTVRENYDQLPLAEMNLRGHSSTAGGFSFLILLVHPGPLILVFAQIVDDVIRSGILASSEENKQNQQSGETLPAIELCPREAAKIVHWQTV